MDLRAAAEAYNRALHAKGKSPTVRQTITASKSTIDRWFAGDVGGMLAAIGQKGPQTKPTYERVMPEDVYAFGLDVHRELGLVDAPEVTDWSDRAAVAAHRAATDHNTHRHYAAENAYLYVQLWEAFGQPPAMKQVAGGAAAAGWLNKNDLDGGWQTLTAAIDRALEHAKAWPEQPTQAMRAATPPASAPPQPAPPSTVSDGQPEHEPQPQRKRGLFRRVLDGRDR